MGQGQTTVSQPFYPKGLPGIVVQNDAFAHICSWTGCVGCYPSGIVIQVKRNQALCPLYQKKRQYIRPSSCVKVCLWNVQSEGFLYTTVHSTIS